MSENLPQPTGGAWQTWANRLLQHLRRTRNLLGHKGTDERASEDGILMWDRENEYPVVSKNGEFRQIVLADGYANFIRTTNLTAASSNTAYPITFDTMIDHSGISQGTPSSRIVFEEDGYYLLSFSAQISSTSGSTVNFWFWPRVNGSDNGSKTMKSALHQNHATLVVSRTALYQISAGDYIEPYWAVSTTNGRLEAFTAESFAPATPSVTLAITRVRQ